MPQPKPPVIDPASIAAGLWRSDDGVWYSSDAQQVSYPQDGNEACFAVEEASFWFKHRNDCIRALVNAYPPRAGGAIFDIGGGNGVVSAMLAAAGFPVALVEPGRTGAINAKNRGLATVICATAETAGFRPHTLPAVGLFDVIEHIEDDARFLRSIRSLLEPRGLLYATVPAYSWLWSDEDVAAGHYRRYTLKGIREVIEEAGFSIEFASYIFRFLPIPIALLRALPYRMGVGGRTNSQGDPAKDHAVRGGRGVRRVLDLLLAPELANLAAGKPMGFGGSCLVAARGR